MTPSECPAKTGLRVTEGTALIPAGAYAERYGSTLIWSHQGRHGTAHVSRCHAQLELDADVMRVRSGVYALKARRCLERIR